MTIKQSKALTAVARNIIQPDLPLYAFGRNVHRAGFIDEHAITGGFQQFIGGEDLPVRRIVLTPSGSARISLSTSSVRKLPKVVQINMSRGSIVS